MKRDTLIESCMNRDILNKCWITMQYREIGTVK